MITYCSNIHPGESWEDIFNNLQTHIPVIKTSVSPDEPFPIGLRLSGLAASECSVQQSADFVKWLQRNNAFVPTINGFPYGSFHRTSVKEQVYLPDWRLPERVNYTKKLADLLDVWLPEDLHGSISTVPIGFKNCIGDTDLVAVRKNLVEVLEHLDRLRQSSGKEIVLALEPEPGCLLETVDDVITFFARMNFPDELRRGLGVCFDCCHHAVEFENPHEALFRLAGAGIKMPKVQMSSAPRLLTPPHSLLESLCEPTYLHQTVIRSSDGKIMRYNDLPDAIRLHQGEAGDEWRIHFHLPVFLENTPWGGTTQDFILKALPLLDRQALLEIETYTWDVLPPEMLMESVTQSIIREIEWLKAHRR